VNHDKIYGGNKINKKADEAEETEKKEGCKVFWDAWWANI
jgi:hypothetical protein